MQAVVEFHGYHDNNYKFIVKEFAIVGENFSSVVVFKPPYTFDQLNSGARRTALWLQKNYHHIGWEEGDVPYDEDVIRTLCKPFSIIYTKGLEKAQFLRKLLPHVEELPEMERYSHCTEVNCILPQHFQYDSKCALKSAKYYYDSLLKLKEQHGL